MDTTLAAVALGSNLGNRHASIDHALDRLGAIEGVFVRARSGLIETAPVGPIEQPDYLNGAATLETTLDAQSLLEKLLSIERSMGRDRTREQRWGPRVIDLDLMLFGDEAIETERLTVPHPRMHERRFVLEPLAEIASDWVHPRMGRSVAELLRALEETVDG